jgi:hypothetical protein
MSSTLWGAGCGGAAVRGRVRPSGALPGGQQGQLHLWLPVCRSWPAAQPALPRVSFKIHIFSDTDSRLFCKQLYGIVILHLDRAILKNCLHEKAVWILTYAKHIKLYEIFKIKIKTWLAGPAQKFVTMPYQLWLKKLWNVLLHPCRKSGVGGRLPEYVLRTQLDPREGYYRWDWWNRNMGPSLGEETVTLFIQKYVSLSLQPEEKW